MSANKKKFLAVGAAVVAFGAMAASAATLGGLNSASLGADATVVASCDTDGVSLAYTNAFDPASSTYKTTAVELADVAAACEGKQFQLTLSGAAGSLVEKAGTVTLTSGKQSVPLAPGVDAKSVTGASLVISG